MNIITSKIRESYHIICVYKSHINDNRSIKKKRGKKWCVGGGKIKIKMYINADSKEKINTQKNIISLHQ